MHDSENREKSVYCVGRVY